MNWREKLRPLALEFATLKAYAPPGIIDPGWMAMKWGEMGFSHRKARVMFVSELIGREIDSFKSLAADEVTTLGSMMDSSSAIVLLRLYHSAKEEWVASKEIKIRPRKTK